MRFTGPDIGKIKDAVIASFNVGELSELALTYLNVDFDNEIAGGKFSRRALDFIIFTNKRNITCDFIHAAYAERPKVPEWQALDKLCNTGPSIVVQAAGIAQAIQLAPGSGPTEAAVSIMVAAPDAPAPARPDRAALEGVVSPRLGIKNFELWRARETSVSAQVCRIDIGPAAAGTGFLVGPDLVLTNHHVLITVIGGQAAASTVRCVFDFKRLADGTINQGRAVGLAAAWLVDKAPPSDAESADRPDDALPKPDQLDFALIRLAAAVGGAPVATQASGPRGWVKLPNLQPPTPKGAPLIIVQHPNANPISMALDTNAVLGFNANGTRLRYATNTEPGSSGSPCFDFDWSIVALHHMGDPNWRNPAYNEGVPIGLIADRIAAFVGQG